MTKFEDIFSEEMIKELTSAVVFPGDEVPDGSHRTADECWITAKIPPLIETPEEIRGIPIYKELIGPCQFPQLTLWSRRNIYGSVTSQISVLPVNKEEIMAYVQELFEELHQNYLSTAEKLLRCNK